MRSILFSAILIFSQFSFGKNPEPTPLEKVKEALQSLRTQAPEAVPVGQYISVDTVETVGGTSPVLRSKESTTVLEKSETVDSVRFYIYYERVDYRNGTPYYRSENGQVIFNKDEPTIFANLPYGDYSELKVEPTNFPTPDIVLHRKNCGGLKDCPAQLSAKKVSFDYENRQGKMFHYEVWGSDQVPFMATPLRFCETTRRTIGEHDLDLTTCRSIVDFSATR